MKIIAIIIAAMAIIAIAAVYWYMPRSETYRCYYGKVASVAVITTKRIGGISLYDLMNPSDTMKEEWVESWTVGNTNMLSFGIYEKYDSLAIEIIRELDRGLEYSEGGLRGSSYSLRDGYQRVISFDGNGNVIEIWDHGKRIW